MAQTKRKRKTKHRGTQAGTIDRAGRTSRQQARTPARKTAGERRAARFDRPPSWRGSVNRAALAAGLFGVLVILLFHRPVETGLIGAAFAFVFYIPVGYLTDRVLYNRRKRQQTRG